MPQSNILSSDRLLEKAPEHHYVKELFYWQMFKPVLEVVELRSALLHKCLYFKPGVSTAPLIVRMTQR